MKVCHTITSIDAKSGGTSTYMQLLSNQLVAKINISLVFLKTNCILPINKGVNIFALKTTFPKFQGYSTQLKKTFKKLDVDLFHGNGLWMYPVHSMCKIARKRNIPYVISPHGMLEPWALNEGKWKKILALTLYQRNDISCAKCIHTTAQMEAENIRSLGFKNPIAIIPNGIDLKDFPLAVRKQKKEKKTILFLSRIHQKKGIEILIEAWAKLDKSMRQNWQVEIAGNGEANYIASLNQLIATKDLKSEITIIGPQFGSDKLDAYQRADLFVLPTYSENFGIVVAEALACGVPVITTKGTPWEELNSCHAGWWIDIGVEPLVHTLQEAIQKNDAERQLKGQNGRKLIEENYSIESVAKQMIQLYEWVLNGEAKPEFVHI